MQKFIVLFTAFCFSGCVAPFYYPPDSIQAAEYRAEYQHREEEEREKLLQKYVGKDKEEISKACGNPAKKEDNPRFKDASYDESWEYQGNCGMNLLPGTYYRTKTFYFINGQVAEVGVFLGG